MINIFFRFFTLEKNILREQSVLPKHIQNNLIVRPFIQRFQYSITKLKYTNTKLIVLYTV